MSCLPSLGTKETVPSGRWETCLSPCLPRHVSLLSWSGEPPADGLAVHAAVDDELLVLKPAQCRAHGVVGGAERFCELRRRPISVRQCEADAVREPGAGHDGRRRLSQV